jgi:hypothetical protein
MARVAAVAFALILTSFAAGSARAQQAAADASSSTNPAETACAGMSLGSDCHSSTQTSGGTCLSGCCCHYVNSPEGAQVCAACLACSDTANTDPAFKTGACSDGGALPSADSGLPAFVDSGTATLPPSAGSTPPPPSGCGCRIAGMNESTAPLAALGAALAVACAVRVRRKSRH